MKLLFVQGGSRWKIDTQGNIYTDTNFNQNVWNRYLNLCDKLTVILRKEEKVYPISEAKNRFNEFPSNQADYIALPDLYTPITNVANVFLRKEIKEKIEESIKKADKVIIRSLGNVYTNTALQCCRKHKKPYLVEVTGFAWESLWYHSIRGKIVAPIRELSCRAMMKDVLYASYVTQNALQKRYKCKGKMLGCSDVELLDLSSEVLESRLKKIQGHNRKIIIGTAASLDVRFKGQEFVIRALAELKNRGVDCFVYQLIGTGEGTRLKELSRKLNVEDSISIIGTLPHSQVFSWLDTIDIYVHPSFTEGLCRSLIEAMSRACPIICTDVGGNVELASPEFLTKKGDYRKLADLLEKMVDRRIREAEARRSFEKSKEYSMEILCKRRNDFYREFILEA